MRPVFAQKLTPWPSVDTTRHPSGSSLSDQRVLIDLAATPSMLTCKHISINISISCAKFKPFCTVIIHFLVPRVKLILFWRIFRWVALRPATFRRLELKLWWPKRDASTLTVQHSAGAQRLYVLDVTERRAYIERVPTYQGTFLGPYSAYSRDMFRPQNGRRYSVLRISNA
jgi:hypothetical protein